MRPRAASLIAAALLATLALPACSSGADGTGSETPGDAAALIRERCTVCHDTSRIEQARKDAAGWRSTVERMRGKGARVSDAEASAIAEFLAGGGASKL